MAIDMSKVKFVEVVSDPADETFNGEEVMQDADHSEGNGRNNNNATGILSKSWEVESAHHMGHC